MAGPFKKIDTKEFELPETVFIRDIESRVFQSIAQECLSRIKDVSLIEGNLIDSFLGREHGGHAGIHVEQDEEAHSVRVKVEVDVAYGVSLPEKAEEIQTKISSDISRLTGLRVSTIHVIFKDLIPTVGEMQKSEVRS